MGANGRVAQDAARMDVGPGGGRLALAGGGGRVTRRAGLAGEAIGLAFSIDAVFWIIGTPIGTAGAGNGAGGGETCGAAIEDSGSVIGGPKTGAGGNAGRGDEGAEAGVGAASCLSRAVFGRMASEARSGGGGASEGAGAVGVSTGGPVGVACGGSAPAGAGASGAGVIAGAGLAIAGSGFSSSGAMGRRDAGSAT